MHISIHDAKHIAFRDCSTYNRCRETPNYYEFYIDESRPQKRTYISKIAGTADDPSHFYCDLFHDFDIRLYEIRMDSETVICNYSYLYYPETGAVAKSDGCTFFDTERGFIFDLDGDCFYDFGNHRSRYRFLISADDAYAIVNSKIYRFLFFDRPMEKEEIIYFEAIHMPYRLIPADECPFADLRRVP